MTTGRAVVLALLVLAVAGCGPMATSSQLYDSSVKPDEGQPAFPALGTYWVVDPHNSCRFSSVTVQRGHTVFEQLRAEKIAEVAVVCQTGIKDNGPFNDGKIWARDWGRWAKLGGVKERRAVVWLIQPDVDPKDHRVTIEVSDWLYQLTAVDYGPALDEAGNYANWDDFDGALESIARNTDRILRTVVVPTATKGGSS
jgi:hypothetical protein